MNPIGTDPYHDTVPPSTLLGLQECLSYKRTSYYTIFQLSTCPPPVYDCIIANVAMFGLHDLRISAVQLYTKLLSGLFIYWCLVLLTTSIRHVFPKILEQGYVFSCNAKVHAICYCRVDTNTNVKAYEACQTATAALSTAFAKAFINLQSTRTHHYFRSHYRQDGETTLF